MRLCYRILLGGIIAAATLSAHSDELPGRDEYAYGFDLLTQGGSEFFSLSVPTAVYQSVTDPELRDAGIYNADGQPVPRIFEHPEVEDNDIERELPLGLVALHGEQAAQPEQLRILLRRTTTTTMLEVDEHSASATAADERADNFPLTAYIVDSRDLEQDIKALEFGWPQQDKGMIGRVRVEDSDDLQVWRRIGSATLADLQLEDTRIEHRRVELNREPGDYLRITWHAMPDGWSLEYITGIYMEKGAPTERDWLTLEAVEKGEHDREYMFDAKGFPPVDRVNVDLGGENVVVRASIFYRHSAQSGWRFSRDAIFYNITRQGNVLHSAAVKVDVQRTAEWKIRVDSGVITGEPLLELGWRPDQLVFLAQGAAPFELLSGRAKDRIDNYPQHSLLGDRAIFKMLRETGQQGVAALGERYEVAGQKSLEAGEESYRRTILLWTGLSAAILLVGWLVFSLIREMRQD